MRIRKPLPNRAAITLVPMVDVLMILLVFFMVTSTYLDLDMVPLVGSSEPPAAVSPGYYGTQQGAAEPQRLLIRLGADGVPLVRGQILPPAALAALLAERLAATPRLDVIVLPSGGASVQALAAVMDAAVAAGVERLRIVRLDPVP